MNFDHGEYAVSIVEKQSRPQGMTLGLSTDKPIEFTEYWAYFNGQHGHPLKAKSLNDAAEEAKGLIDNGLVTAISQQ